MFRFIETYQIRRKFSQACRSNDVDLFFSIWGNKDLAKLAAPIVAQASPDFRRKIASMMLNEGVPTKRRGLAAHILMRAISIDPSIGDDQGIRTAFETASHDTDFFVRENAVRALEDVERAKQEAELRTVSTPKKQGMPKPTAVVPGKRHPSGGYLCPYCGKGNYEPYPDFGSTNRRCRECKTVFSTTDLLG